MTSLAAPLTKFSPWFVGPVYDLAFIFGGAAVSLSIPLIVLWQPSWLTWMFWIWILLFDGTHLWAAYSRTYVDREYWRTDKVLLVGSLAVFLVPIAAIGFAWVTGSQHPVELFLLFALGWAYYHIVKQHYGFVSIYDRKAGIRARAHTVNKWTLYVGLAMPYLFWILHHPVNRGAMQLDLPPDSLGNRLTEWVPMGSSVAAVIGFVAFWIWESRRTQYQPGLGFWFVLVCIATYSAIFYFIAPLEPLFPQARSAVQSFMVVAMMMSLFHNIQYHAIVWQFNRRKYRNPRESTQLHGPARWINRNFFIYAGVAVLFSCFYAAIAWWSTNYPAPDGKLMTPVFVPAAFCLWWGLLFHHYYLDQKIWRVSRKKDLQEHLEVPV